MPGLTCNSCNKEFFDESDQRLHYRSEWHRYNLKRKVAGVPGVTEALFLARQASLAQEKAGIDDSSRLYCCNLCNKGYRSDKALAQHLKSRGHLLRASGGKDCDEEGSTVIKTLRQPLRGSNMPASGKEPRSAESEESEDEWEEVGSDDELIGGAAESLSELVVDKPSPSQDMDDDSDDDIDDALKELDPSCCFMCDVKHDSLEHCMVHMHKQHGFFIPDVEFLKDPEGLLTYLGLKVKRDYMCLYCNDRRQPFSSLEAVRKHMVAKSHCKVHYGSGDDDEEAELEEFYDYSSSYMGEDGKQLVLSGDAANSVELGSGGSELVITSRSEDGTLTKTLGSREFLRYYRQKPRPSSSQHGAIAVALASRYRSMGLATVQSRERVVRMKVMKEMNRTGVESMRTKIAMKSNIIRNLPNNVPY
ncbi:hypothetical protein MLD38_014007 [Melastoma candidum]|uniref:Uncharacterized protein n=1 Tax=Melastoma candidum TaxID=119954 RepID=A0ACB9RBZ6_9MYRT|nr:hypothetical protein MLD38_014007 [Melastoma candidum]